MLVAQRREPLYVLVGDLEPLGAQAVQRQVHVARVPKADRVDDQPERAQLVFLAFAVAFSDFAFLAVEERASQGVALLVKV